MEELRTAFFGMGCFWGAEEAFRMLKGVINTEVGYMGGITKNPTYPRVCKGNTGHIEVIKITYDPEVVSYEELISIFWKKHDPTTPNRQGWDVGEQYSSNIFYTTEEQKEVAEKSLEEAQSKYCSRITTKIRKAAEFYPAEEYHQKYIMKKNNSLLNF